jgi:F0F1-type ATP synthase assembly protein I
LRYAHLGLQLAITIALFAGIGYWLDKKWGRAPWGFLGGFAIGVTVGMTVFLLDVLKEKK